MPELAVAFGIVAAVLIVTALASGLIERSPISFSLLFLGLGLGLARADIIRVEVHSPVLEVVGTLTLALVMFLDATRLQVEELGRRWVVPALVLGPGTVLVVALGTGALRLVLGFDWLLALMGGAMLASTDPVLLRELLRDGRIPRSIRQVLKLEAGMNDLVVLPVILVLIAVARAEVNGVAGWVEFLVRLLAIGPVVGFAIGGAGAWAMNRLDRVAAVREEQQALYGVGLVIASYAAASAVRGDGFLSAFAAGLAVTLLNQTLCDCFLEFGETIAEMAMLVSFVLFGAVLAALIVSAELLPALAVAALVVFAIRPLAMLLVLFRSEMSREGRLFVGWLGPRGLASLLLSLLAVQRGVPGAELVLASVGVVVLFSSLVHGASTPLLIRWYLGQVERRTLAEEREGSAEVLAPNDGPGGTETVTPDELAAMLAGPEPPTVIDVRSRSDYLGASTRIPGSVRVLADQALQWVAGHDRARLIVAYCT